MNLILSLILCAAMALSGTPNLPAEPDARTQWTISNVVLGVGYEYVNLDDVLVLTGSVGENSASLEMLVESEGSSMLPAALEVNDEALLLSFGSGKYAYSLDNDVIWEASQMTEEDGEFARIGEGFFTNLGKLIAMLHDGEFLEDLLREIEDAEAPMYDTHRDAEVEIEGVLYPAKYRSAEYTDVEMMGMYERMLDTDQPVLAAMIESMGEVVCLLEGVDTKEGFDGLARRYAAEADELNRSFTEEVTVAEEGMDYVAARGRTTGPEGESISDQSGEIIRRPDSTVIRFLQNAAIEAGNSSLEAELTVTGPADAVSAVDLTGSYSTLEDYSYPTKRGGEDVTFIRTNERRTEFDLIASKNVGLWSMKLDLEIDEIYDYGYESDRRRDQEYVNLSFGCTENRIGGDPVYTIVVEAESGNDEIYLSFDLARESLTYVDPFAGRELCVIDLDDAGSGAEYLRLASDAMSFAGSAMMLAGQEDIMMASVLLESIGYEEYEVLESFEYARRYYGIDWPEYTPPEGYVLDSIRDPMEHAGRMEVYYWSEAEQDAILVTYDDFRGLAPYSGLDEQKLEKGPIVQSTIVDGLVYNIDVYTPEVHVTISTNGMRQEMMDVLLSGLDVVSLYMDEADLAEYEESLKNKI